jgi:hypothetical protein
MLVSADRLAGGEILPEMTWRARALSLALSCE